MEELMAKKNDYNANSIQALSQRNHLLKRLSLTFGRETGDKETPFSSQKSVAIREIIDNAVDEVLGGYGDKIRVSYYKDGSYEIQDNGRGLPVDAGTDSTGKAASGIYLCLGVIQSGGKFTVDSKQYTSGLNGVGAASTQSTSKRMDVTVYRDNKVYSLSFKDGEPGFFDKKNDPEANFSVLDDFTYLKVEKDKRPTEEKKKFKTGTIVRTWLRDSVYSSEYPVNTLDLTERLRGTAFLIPNMTITIHDEVNVIKDEVTGEEKPREDEFQFGGGISELVDANLVGEKVGTTFFFETETSFLERNVPVLENNKVINKDVERTLPIEVAFAWNKGFDYEVESYVNTIRTRLGGIHESAFEKALISAFGDRFKSLQGLMTAKDPKLTFEDFKEGLTAVVYVRIPEPQFSGQNKEELNGRAAHNAIVKKLTEVMTEFAFKQKNSDLMREIGAKVVQAARNRQFAHDQQALNRKKNAIESSGSMPEKLTDCEITGTEDSELYIVEGDSAEGSLKGARFGKFQALLPIRGKIICASNNPMKKVMENKEVQGIIKALGAGSGDTFDTSKLRYGRVFIATDADPDGGDIAALLISFFWELARPLIEEGRLYKLVTPLFVFETKSKKGKGKERHYANSDEEKTELMANFDAKGIKYQINRLKGLGEGGNDVMIETAMSPLTRTVERVVIKDVKESQNMMNIIFGEDTQRRKDWLAANPMDEFENIE